MSSGTRRLSVRYRLNDCALINGGGSGNEGCGTLRNGLFSFMACKTPRLIDGDPAVPFISAFSRQLVLHRVADIYTLIGTFSCQELPSSHGGTPKKKV
ncbi:hypothetical protein GN956_G9783 [Arapaima gigas]